ncbi:MAG: aspartyl protease family protein, partial [Myxococcota bacterium]
SLPAWGVGSLPRDGRRIVTDALPDRVLDAEAAGEIFGLGGVVGADLLSRQPWWIDPRGQRLWFVDPPTGIERVETVPVEVAGGGSTCLSDGTCFDHDPSRLLVEATIAGEPMTLMVDTASTYVGLKASVFDRLGIDPPTFDFGTAAFGVAGATVGIGGTEVDRVRIAEVDAATEESLVRLALEVDRPIDGLLGHAFLLGFVVGIDQEGGELTLSRYASGPWDPLPDPVHPGVSVGDGEGDCFAVRYLVVGSPADRAGIDFGTCVTAVGGRTPADVDGTTLMADLAALGDGAPVDWAWDGGAATLDNVDWLR